MACKLFPLEDFVRFFIVEQIIFVGAILQKKVLRTGRRKTLFRIN